MVGWCLVDGDNEYALVLHSDVIGPVDRIVGAVHIDFDSKLYKRELQPKIIPLFGR
jgi:hypothetical protein